MHVSLRVVSREKAGDVAKCLDARLAAEYRDDKRIPDLYTGPEPAPLIERVAKSRKGCDMLFARPGMEGRI